MNKINRNIFIGDIHWCIDEFKLLIKKLELWENDHVFLTWDLILKWPKSLKVLKYVYKNRHRFSFVLWNKEYEVLEGIKWGDYDSIEKRKIGEKLKKKYPELLRYLENTPYYIEHSHFILVHGWIIPGKKLEEHSPLELCYLREYMWKPWYEYYVGNKKVIYWHRAFDELKIRENTIWLDSWCVYGGKLSAYILETWDLVQVQATKLHKNFFEKWSFGYYYKKISFTFSMIFKWR